MDWDWLAVLLLIIGTLDKLTKKREDIFSTSRLVQENSIKELRKSRKQL